MPESTPEPLENPTPVQARHRWATLIKLDWRTLALEMFTVVVGVVLGMQVANWNDERRERAEVARLLDHLRPELRANIQGTRELAAYYAVTRAYAETALKGWRGDPAVTDDAFVIAAYQASQIIGTSTNGATWAAIFGGEELRRIDDFALRKALVTVVTTDTEFQTTEAVDTPYRRNVRRVIPADVQALIRAKCGDRSTGVMYTLPARCDIALPAGVGASVAAALRRQPELAGDLNWHLGETAAAVLNSEAYREQMEDLYRRIGASKQG